ncbi:MAG: hypothetical protein KDA17_07660 [Candidatus Saccharibacteria bacterium]|nr:hypothetical protein [Candidatus Saccharibacteria bacterium]
MKARIEAAEKNSSRAINNPVSFTDRLESGDMQIGQDGVVDEKNGVIIKPSQQQLDDPDFIKKAEILQFMNEMVTVEIADTSDEKDDHGFVIEVNGMKCPFHRGERKTVRRFFVEGLARAKKTSYTAKKKTEDDGDNIFNYPSKTGLRYPFSVVDDSQRGKEWLRAVLRQP